MSVSSLHKRFFMVALIRVIPAAAIGLVLATGCAAPTPWSPGQDAGSTPAAPATPAPTTPAQPIPASPPPPQPVAAAATENAALQQVVAEFQQMGDLDPTTRDELIAGLQGVDPALLPLVAQQARAMAAYRRGDAPHADAPTVAVAYTAASPRTGPAPPARLPVAPGVIDSPRAAPQVAYPTTPHAAATPSQPGAMHSATLRSAPGRLAATEDAHPQKDIPAASQAGDWRDHLARAAAALEAEIVADSTRAGEEAVASNDRHVRLRMLHMLAGRREEALRPIPATEQAGLQEFWNKEIYALATLLEANDAEQVAQRAEQARAALAEAIVQLSEAAPLIVGNMAFCTEVFSYGSLKPFPKNEFRPGQEVLLYAELENFTSESTPKGFHTSLRGSYEIFDARGRRVTEKQLGETQEHCCNPRRDYFISYNFHLPRQIFAGRHTLQLTIEDLKGRKIGQSKIDLTIVDSGE